MKFPCPHCGGELAFTDRKIDEIKPIIPLDLQETFKEPPEPKHNLISSISPLYRSIESPEPRYTQIQTPPPSYVSNSSPPLRSFNVQTTFSVPPPPPPIQSSINEQSRTPPPTPTGASVPLPPKLFSQPSTTISKEKLDRIVLSDDEKKSFESRFKGLESRSRHLESQNIKFESKFKETDQQLKMIRKFMKTILKSNQKL
ncbi:MAG: hypothetical protein ACFFAU_19425 [Candidatus Hodarchaeota archaeon]